MYNDNHAQQRYGHYNRRSQQHNRQEMGQRGYLHNPQNANNNNVNVINALVNYSTKQALTQSMLNALQEYGSGDREATISWLDQVELTTENSGIDPLEIVISKLKGLALVDISTLHKEEGLSWHKFRQPLIEQYLSVPHVLDTMLTYSKISQWDKKLTTRYLVRAKVLLEPIHRMSKLSEISGYSMDNLSLIHSLWEHHMRKSGAKEQESWHTMEDVFKSINCVIIMEERSKVYHQPEYDTVYPISIKRVHELSTPNRYVKPWTSLPNQIFSNTQHNPHVALLSEMCTNLLVANTIANTIGTKEGHSTIKHLPI